LESCSRK